MRTQPAHDYAGSPCSVPTTRTRQPAGQLDVGDVPVAACPVIMLLTVRAELLLLLLAALDRELPRLGRAQLVAASVPVLRAKGMSLHDFLAEEQPALVLYDISSPYRASWTALERVRAAGVVPAERLIVLTGNKHALEMAVGPTAALEVSPGATALDEVVQVLYRQLARQRSTGCPETLHPVFQSAQPRMQ